MAKFELFHHDRNCLFGLQLLMQRRMDRRIWKL